MRLPETRAAALALAAIALAEACSLGAGRPASRQGPVLVAGELERADVARRRVASGLANPRAMLRNADGSLLVATAGSGRSADGASGAVLILTDRDGDGSYEGTNERRPLLKGAPSVNIVEMVRRDEVFGMSALARGDGRTLAAIAFFDRPSELWSIAGASVESWSTVDGNINDLVFDDKRGAWFAVSSSSDELLRLDTDGRSEIIARFGPLEQGQDAVPGYLAIDKERDRLLVSLFSGSAAGETGGLGTEFVRGAGRILSVDPDTGKAETLVAGLTAPTDLVLAANGRLLVLEFCDGFLDPVTDPAALTGGASHGGFRRFSGRLIEIDLVTGSSRQLAGGLDTPTNLLLDGSSVLVSEGMGTPGRPIPGPEGTTALDGFIEAFRRRS